MQNKTFQKPKPDKRPAFSFSKIQTLSSLYQLPQCSSSTSSPHAQTHSKPTEISFLRPTAKHPKTPYPQIPQSKPTTPTTPTIRPYPQTNRDLLPQTHGKDHFSFLQNADPPTTTSHKPPTTMSVSDTPSHPAQPSQRYTITPNPARRNWSTKVTNIQI